MSWVYIFWLMVPIADVVVMSFFSYSLSYTTCIFLVRESHQFAIRWSFGRWWQSNWKMNKHRHHRRLTLTKYILAFVFNVLKRFSFRLYVRPRKRRNLFTPHTHQIRQVNNKMKMVHVLVSFPSKVEVSKRSYDRWKKNET